MGRWRAGLLMGLALVVSGLVAACGGGGGGSSGAGGENVDRTLSVTGVSETDAAPFGLVTVTGEGFDATAETYVRFTSADGDFDASVPAVGVTATSVTAAVPPYLDPEGHPGSGTVGVRVQQKAGAQEVESAAWEGFQILALPATGLPPGTVTLDFAQALSGLAGDLETQIAGTALDTAEMRASLGQLGQAYGDLANRVQAVMEGTAQSFTLGTLAGTSQAIGPAQLADADRILVAIVGQVADAQLARAAASAGLFREGTEGWTPSAAERETRRILALASADYTDCLLHSPESGCSTQRIQLVTETTPEAFKRAYQVVVGSAGVVLGIMTLGGAPAAATALPSAALSYVQLAGGSGLIAVGGVLQQTTADAKGIVQQGVETFDGFLKSLAETFLTAFVPGTEELVAVKNILEGGSDLLDAFGAADLNSQPTDGGTGIGTFSSSFTGTTVEVSGIATLTYQVIGAVTATLTGGAGTMIDPYQGSLVVEGTVFVDCTPNLQGATCENTSAPFRIEGPVQGLSGAIEGWAGGDSIDQSPAVFRGGVLSGDELSGQFSFDVGCTWECAQPIAKAITMIRMP